MKALLLLLNTALLPPLAACSGGDDGGAGSGNRLQAALLDDLKTWIQAECDCENSGCDDEDLNRTADDPALQCVVEAVDSTTDEALLDAVDCYITGVAFMAECAAAASACVEEELQCDVPECPSGVTLGPLFDAFSACEPS